MEVQVFDINGKALKKLQLPESVFGVPMNENILHAVIKGYLANKRQGTHSTKTKGLVSGGGKKPFKQKGTGQARQGSSRSPLMPGGGKAHGPHPRDYREKLTRSTRQLALKVALSDKVRHGKLLVVNDFAISAYSTKHVVKALESLKTPSALLSDERKDDFLYRSARNIHGAAVMAPGELNAEHVLRHESIILSENALTALKQRFEEKKRESV